LVLSAPEVGPALLGVLGLLALPGREGARQAALDREAPRESGKLVLLDTRALWVLLVRLGRVAQRATSLVLGDLEALPAPGERRGTLRDHEGLPVLAA